MTALVLMALVASACSSMMPLPPLRVDGVEVRVEQSAQDVIASAAHEPRGPVIYLAPRFHDLSPVVQWWALAHELCHLRGMRTEGGADCCAWRWGVDVFGWGDEEVVEILETLRMSRRDLALLECYMGE